MLQRSPHFLFAQSLKPLAVPASVALRHCAGVAAQVPAALHCLTTAVSTQLVSPGAQIVQASPQALPAHGSYPVAGAAASVVATGAGAGAGAGAGGCSYL